MEELNGPDQLIIYLRGKVIGQYTAGAKKTFYFCDNPLCEGFILADMNFYTEK